MKISIITPVYNTAHYLKQCIDSVMRQTHSDFQLICIDDASTDGSWELLQEYAGDSRVVLLRNERNEGPAKARNRASRLADGDIVAMLDSDDVLQNDALEKLHAEFAGNPQTDCVLYNLVLLYSDGTVKPWQSETTKSPVEKTVLSGPEACSLSIDWRIHGVYAMRRELAEKYPYDATCHSFSDDNTTRLHYLKSREVRISNAIYFYRQRPDSITHRRSMQEGQMLDALVELKAMLANEGVGQGDLDRVETMRWRHVMGGYMHYYARRQPMSPSEWTAYREKLDTHYRSIPAGSLPRSMRCRFGYAPIKWCPPLYRLQMLLFTRLRLFLGMDKGRY